MNKADSKDQAAEAWLFDNEKALKQLQKGLKQSVQGKTTSYGSFSEYLND